ncbi:MAG: hypothetical protein ACI9Y7_000317 [Dokdonia sp.]|jgi:hypothetical protein
MTLWGQSQSHEFKIDYTVKYLVENKQGSKDTVSIGFEKNGKYLWSDYKGIVREFASKVLNDDNDIPSGSSNIIYSSADGKLYIILDIDAFKMTLDTEIAALLPGGNANNSMNEKAELKHEKSNQNFMFDGKKVDVYKIFPNTEPQNEIYMAIDTSYSLDNNFLFQNFLNIMLNATSSKGEIKINIPNGIILSMTGPSSDKMLIEAISVDTKSRKISLNNSFKISE